MPRFDDEDEDDDFFHQSVQWWFRNNPHLDKESTLMEQAAEVVGLKLIASLEHSSSSADTTRRDADWLR